MTENTSWRDMRTELLKDDETRAAYERLEERMRMVRAVIARRTELGWSQRDLAREAGIAQPAVARFERADSDPRFGTVAKICSALGLMVMVGSEVVVVDPSKATGRPARTKKAAAKPAGKTKVRSAVVGGEVIKHSPAGKIRGYGKTLKAPGVGVKSSRRVK